VKRFIPILFLFSFCQANATSPICGKLAVNPDTGYRDCVGISVSSDTLPSGSTQYIQNGSSYQTGATANILSLITQGTIQALGNLYVGNYTSGIYPYIVGAAANGSLFLNGGASGSSAFWFREGGSNKAKFGGNGLAGCYSMDVSTPGFSSTMLAPPKRIMVDTISEAVTINPQNAGFQVTTSSITFLNQDSGGVIIPHSSMDWKTPYRMTFSTGVVAPMFYGLGTGLTDLVPYVGATTNVDLGSNNLTASRLTATDKIINSLTGHGNYDGFFTQYYIPFGHYLNQAAVRHDPWFCYLAGVYQPGDTSGYGLEAGDGTRYVYLADGTYAVNATGPSLFSGNVNSTGTITGTSLIKSGGTSSQFLKADGSVDSSTYLTTIPNEAYTAQTTTYAILTTDSFVGCNGTFTATLPTAASVTGKNYTIKNTGTGVVTIATTSSQTIDGVTTYVIRTTNSGVTLISNGANWLIKAVF
jgi:hypothetical protein